MLIDLLCAHYIVQRESRFFRVGLKLIATLAILSPNASFLLAGIAETGGGTNGYILFS